MPAWVVEFPTVQEQGLVQGLRLQHSVEQVVDAPAPQTMDKLDEGTAKVVPQERVQQWILEQLVDELVPQERAVQRTVEQIVDVPGPHILVSSSKLVPQEREQQRVSSKWNKLVPQE